MKSRIPLTALWIGEDDTPWLVEALDPLGVVLTHCQSGKLGLEHLKRVTPDLCLVSDHLPDMVDGYAFVDRIRSEPQWNEMPIIRIVDNQHPVVRGGGGVEALIAQPVQPCRLQELVRRVFEDRLPALGLAVS